MCPKLGGKVQAKLSLAVLFSQVKLVHLTALNLCAISQSASSRPVCAQLSPKHSPAARDELLLRGGYVGQGLVNWKTLQI